MATSMLNKVQARQPKALRKITPKNTKPKEITVVPDMPLLILVCTPDASSAMTKNCIRSLKDTAGHIEHTLVIRDNNRSKSFSHPREINAALEAHEGYLCICDDDVTFTDGWLDSALSIMQENQDCGLVAFHLYWPDGRLWASALQNDGAKANRIQTVYNAPVCIPSQCSACFLIAPTQKRMDERYRKYRFEVDFCKRLWESGKTVMLSPAKIFHRIGGQNNNLTTGKQREDAYASDRATFCKDWIDTGRLVRLQRKIAKHMPPGIDYEHVRPGKRAMATVAIGEEYKQSLSLIKRLARKCKADFFCFDESMIKEGENPKALKWRINDIIDDYEQVAMIDGDAMPLPWCPCIFDTVPVGTLGVYDEAQLFSEGCRVDRQKTYEEYRKKAAIEWGMKFPEYPGHYFNSGIMVFDKSCNPFVTKADGVYAFPGDVLFDQTWLNCQAAEMPKTLLDYKWNRLNVKRAHMAYGNDMIKDCYIPHYCCEDGRRRLERDIKRIMPKAVERPPGKRLDGLYDLCKWIIDDGGDISKIIEVGSAHGESMWVFTEMFPNAKADCFDPFNSERYGDAALRDFCIRHKWNENVTHYRKRFEDMLSAITDRSADLMYLDATHDYDSVKYQILRGLPKVRSGGYIGGHDYSESGDGKWKGWPGCVKAINEIFGKPDAVFQDSSWIVKVK